LPNSELKTWRRALKTSCWPPSRQTQRSSYCGNGWLARAGRWNVPRNGLIWRHRRGLTA
ncbi:hypothetical protein T09_5776, partial [Trichinella sp. T9]